MLNHSIDTNAVSWKLPCISNIRFPNQPDRRFDALESPRRGEFQSILRRMTGLMKQLDTSDLDISRNTNDIADSALE